MKCRECDAWTEVYDSRDRNGVRVRRYRCGNDHRYQTVEIYDRRAKPRQHRGKLTDDQVRAIRQDSRPLADVAQDYSIPQSSVSRIRDRITYKNVE